MRIFQPIISGSTEIQGSLNVLGGITGSLFGTASYSLTASYALNSTATVDTGSLLVTASVVDNTITFTKGDASTFSITVATGSSVNNAESASYAATASYVLNSISSSYAVTASYALNAGVTIDTGSLLVTASVVDNVITFTKGDASTFDIIVATGSSAISASYAVTASYAEIALSSSYSMTASYVEIAQTASYVTLAQTASYVLNSISSSYAATASYVNQLNQQVVINGVLELKSAHAPSIDINSGYFYVSQSEDSGDPGETDIYYYHKGNKFSFDWIEGQLDTGIKWGGAVSFAGSTIFVKPGSGLIVNHNPSTSSYGDTQVTTVNWGPITASATFITSSQITYLLIDSDGTLLQQPSIFTPQQYNEKFPLGYIFCLTTSSISSYADGRVTTYGINEQQNQFIRAFGPLKINGFDITAQSGSLRLSIAPGRSYRVGGFYIQNPDEPSIYDSENIATGSFVRIYRDPAAVGGFRATLNGFFPYTTIDPTMWDDGSGTLQSVGASEWTIQRLFQGVGSGITYVYYGQSKYSTLSDAIANIATDSFEESQTSIIALPFIGYVICKGDTTNLADTTNNRIFNAGLFRNTAGASGGGGAATTNLDALNDVNLSSPSTGQALIYDAGNWINGTPLNATSASAAVNSLSASYAILANNANTASFITGSNVYGPYGSNSVISASFAVTASYALSPPTWTVKTVTGTASTASLNDYVLVNADSHTVFLPAASANAKVGVKWIVAPTTGSVRTPSVGVTIDGTDRSTTGLFLYNQWDAYSFISDGTNWFIIG